MERLTRKTMFGDYGLEEETKQDAVVNKLGKLEDIEEQLGIDLITLLKAETIYWRIHYIDTDEYSKIMKSYKVHIDLNNKCLKVYNEFDEFGYDLQFKNYGKTWALTKEELEK